MASSILQNLSWDSVAGRIRVLFKDGGGSKLIPDTETGSFVATFTQSGGYSAQPTILYTRIGDVVHLWIPKFIANSTAANTIDTAAGAVPVSLRPSAPRNLICFARSGALSRASVMIIHIDGSLNLYWIVGDVFSAFPISTGSSGLGQDLPTSYIK